MPPVIAAVAAVAAYVGTSYLVVAAVVIAAGSAIYGAAQARKAERAAREAMNSALKDRMVTRIATESPHRYIYGRAKVGADIVAMFTTGDKDQYRHLVCVHAAHECDAIEEVWVNNKLVGAPNANGEATSGSFAVNPGSEVIEENHTGPQFTLTHSPRNKVVWVFGGAGSNMHRLPVKAVNGKTVTIEYAGPVVVNYERAVFRNMSGSFSEPVQEKMPVVSVRKHLGGPDDGVDMQLRAMVGDKWPETAVLRGMCYTVITLDLNHSEFQGGLVPIHAVIRGRKLYDPRTGEKKWSQNPALAIMDYLTSPLCAVPMEDLPLAQFITAANVCDEQWNVEGGRYTINGTVNSDQSQSTVLEAMTQAMAGGLVATTWDVYAGKYVAPIAALSQEDIVGGLSITPGVSDASIYNGIKGQYIAPENNNVMTDFKPYQNAAYREADGRDLYSNIDFPFTDTLQRVTNLARIFTEDQRNGFTIKADFSLKAWPLKVGQRITFTSKLLGQNAKVYRITDKAYSPNSAVQLTLKEDAASIWDYADAVTVDSTPNSDLPDPWAVAPLASLTCSSGEATLLRQADGSTVPRILVSWPAATTQGVFGSGQIEVEWRAVSSMAWSRATVAGNETYAYLSPITPGFYYIIRARCVNPYLNTTSDWITELYQVVVFSAQPRVYQWAASMPDAPTGNASFDWVTGTYAAPSGWAVDAAAAPAAGGASLWMGEVLVTDVSVDAPTPFSWAAARVASVGYEEASGTKNTTAVFAASRIWDFSGTVEGWAQDGGTATVTYGANSIIVTSTHATDPRIISPAGLALAGSQGDKIRMRLRRTSGDKWDGTLYYATSAGPNPLHGMVGTYCKQVVQDPTTGGAWAILEWDMSELTAGGTDYLVSTVDRIRFDLGASIDDVFEIDWIAIGRYAPATAGAPSGTLVGGVSADAVATATTNFNASNDRNGAAVAAPTILADGTAVDHTIRTDGAADISFEWGWTGNEGDIDGFLIHVYQSTASTAYTFGTTPAAETVYTVPANRRAFILFGSAANLYTTFGVQAYRSVDKDVAAGGAIKSAIVKPSFATENPYRPSANVPFAGDVTGTVSGRLAGAIVKASNIDVSGDKNNLVVDPQFMDLNWWGMAGLPGIRVANWSAAGQVTWWKYGVSMYFEPTGGAQRRAESVTIPIVPGATYLIEYQISFSNDWYGDLSIRWHTYWNKVDTLDIGTSGYTFPNGEAIQYPSTSRGTRQISKLVTLPQNSAVNGSQFIIMWASHTGVCEIGGFTINRVIDGTLIKDESVGRNHLKLDKISITGLSNVNGGSGLPNTTAWRAYGSLTLGALNGTAPYTFKCFLNVTEGNLIMSQFGNTVQLSGRGNGVSNSGQSNSGTLTVVVTDAKGLSVQDSAGVSGSHGIIQ